MDFTVILQSPDVRAIVQDGILERAFHDALFPRMLFRGEVSPQPWSAGIGDSQIFSAPGLMAPDATPIVPGNDPGTSSYPLEQWIAQMNQYGKAIDTHMPTSMVAIVNLFLRNAHQLGLQSAQTMNRIVRNRMYGAALSGNTETTSGSGASTTVPVARLQGLTRARNPGVSGASTVKYELVSSTNPLQVHILDNGADAVFNVTGFTPNVPGDESGPGTITLSSAPTNIGNRAYVQASDKTPITRVGGAQTIDGITGANVPTLADVRSVVSGMWQDSVPEHPDGRFHAHVDPISQAKFFNDNEFQRLLTALPDYYMYRQFALGEILGTVFFRNNECPLPETVVGNSGVTAYANLVYDPRDPFPGELLNLTGVRLHRVLFTGQGGIYEYYADLSQPLTEAGVTGKVGEARIVNNGIEVLTDRIQLIIRAPLNRFQDQVSTAWKFMGDWPVRTDGATGSPARYKRLRVIEHGE